MITLDNEDEAIGYAARWAEAHIAVGSEWLDDAACADLNLDDFFSLKRVKLEVLRVCAGCPVKWQCLDDVSRYEQVGTTKQDIKGFFAGLTPTERSILYKKPRSSWPDEQIKLIKNHLKEKNAISKMSIELRDALFPNGGY